MFLETAAAAFGRTSVYTGMERETEIHLALAKVFAGHDALVCPTFGGMGLEAGNSYLPGFDVAGPHLEISIFAALPPVFNVASRHPVLAVPSGIASNGVPTGVQVVARPYGDGTAFQVGAAAERGLGLWD